MTNIATR